MKTIEVLFGGLSVIFIVLSILMYATLLDIRDELRSISSTISGYDVSQVEK